MEPVSALIATRRQPEIRAKRRGMPSDVSAPVIVVGAGLAGLACAQRLNQADVAVQILEASDAVGGRVRTDLLDGGDGRRAS